MGKDKKDSISEDLGNIWFFSAIGSLNKSNDPKVLSIKTEKLSDLLSEMKRVHKAMTGHDHLLGSHLQGLDLSDRDLKRSLRALSFESKKVKKALFFGLSKVAEANGTGAQPWLQELAK